MSNYKYLAQYKNNELMECIYGIPGSGKPRCLALFVGDGALGAVVIANVGVALVVGHFADGVIYRRPAEHSPCLVTRSAIRRTLNSSVKTAVFYFFFFIIFFILFLKNYSNYFYSN